MKKIHPSQKKILELLRGQENQFSIRDLQEHLDISSPSVVYHHIQQLEKKGLLSRNPNNPGDYRVVEPQQEGIFFLPVYGIATCGPQGKVLEQTPIRSLPVSADLLSFPVQDAIFVQAKGDSMLPRIHDGDLVLIERGRPARHGQMVLCSLDGQAMIKLLHHQNHRTALISLHPLFVDIEVAATISDFWIEGIVRGVLNFSL